MTTLADKIEALAKDAVQTADDIRYYSGGSKHNQPAEDLADLVMRNLPTILRALRERDQAVEALREIADGSETGRGCGEYGCPWPDFARTTLASIEGTGHE